MAEDERAPAAYAADIEAARDRLIAFAGSCSEGEWRAAPLDGDPRPVAVVVDHVADSYEYLAGWIRQLVAGQPVEVTGEIVDDLNADSLDLVELIMSMEEEFSKDGKTLEISDEDAEKIATVQDAIDYLKDLGIEDE